MEQELAKRQERWPLCSRFFSLVFGSGAIIASVFSVYSCEFFSYKSLDGQPWEGLTPPFDELASASVGLFRYSATISDNDTLFGESCVNYEDWTDVGQGAYFFAAQWCSLIAPCMAFLALLQLTCECCMCRLKGSYVLNRFFFISASVLQMCSFLVFSETQFCFEAASQNQCRLRNGAFYSLGSAITFLLLAISSIGMMPYKDVQSCMGCCVSTRVPKQRKSATTTSKVEGDTTSEDDGDRQNRAEKDPDDDDDDSEKLLDVHSTREQQDANRLVEDEEITVDQYSRQQEQNQHRMEEFPTNEADVVAEILSTDQNDNDDGKSADASSSKTRENAALDIESPFPEQEQEAQQIVQTDTLDSEQTRSPDFLDMCCGDPLELERYLGRKNDASTKKLMAAEGGTNESTTPSLQSSLSKMAIEDESKEAAATLGFQYSKEQSEN